MALSPFFPIREIDMHVFCKARCCARWAILLACVYLQVKIVGAQQASLNLKTAAGEPPGPVLDDFNELLSEALRHLQVASTGGWDWRGRGEDLESVLWPVVWSAAALLTSAEAERLRVCGGPDCGWMYVDRSRNGLRRWCQMETCGTREKSRRRQRRSSTRP